MMILEKVSIMYAYSITWKSLFYFKGNQLDGVFLILKLVRLLKYFCHVLKKDLPAQQLK